MTRLKITTGEWAAVRVGSGIVEVWSKGTKVAELRGHDAKADGMFVAEAGTVANETGLMPRELLAQRDELSAIVNQILDETAGQYLSDAMRDRALAAIARVRGEARVPEQ